MPEIDPAHILFASDAPPATRQAQVAAAQPAGQVRQSDEAARSLFPKEGAASSAGQPAGKSSDGDAETLFPGERPEARDDGAIDTVEPLDRLAEAVRLSGDVERADALAQATDVLLADAADHGTPADDLREIVEAVHGAAGTLTPMTPEQLANGQAKAMRELSDIPTADLDLARGLIRQMERKMPGLAHQLEISGLGNDVKFIRAVCREAVRRSGRR